MSQVMSRVVSQVSQVMSQVVPLRVRRGLGAAAVGVAVSVSVSVAGLCAALPAHSDSHFRFHAHSQVGAVLAPPPVRDEDRVDGGDHLTVTLRDAGSRRDGTFEVYCHPEGGSHPDVAGACLALDGKTRWGTDVFAPAAGPETGPAAGPETGPAAGPETGPEVGEGVCTMQYGGPATAHVTGRWAGRPVDAVYDRRDGCAIERWDALVPLLPKLP